MSNDTVSRDGVKNLLTRIRDEIDEGYGFNYQEAVEELMGMPSTQPQLEQSTHSEQGKSDELGVKSGKTCTDTISRQAAITAIQKAYTDTEGGTDKCAVWKNVGLTNALHIMQDLPPAQPEIANQTEESAQNVPNGELISKKAAIDALGKDVMGGLNYKRILNSLPSAQPDIIRCRDCKWHNGEINQCNAQVCASMCGDDFCSRAERREE